MAFASMRLSTCFLGITEDKGGLYMFTIRIWIAAGIAAVAFVGLAVAQNDLTPKNRQELKHDPIKLRDV
jgi:hypothetical protein